jgi:hypothetical protein
MSNSPHGKRGGTRIAVAATAVVAGSAGLWAPSASAGIPSADGTVYACFYHHNGGSRPNGSVRVINYPTDKCKKHETLLSWKGALGAAGGSAGQGPQGPQGAQGPQGPAGGPQGPQGPAGAQGPQGPAGATTLVDGPQGPPGPQGATGATGPLGSITSYVISESADFDDTPTSGDHYFVTAFCTEGDIATGGGYNLGSDNGDWRADYAGPSDGTGIIGSGNPVAWTAEFTYVALSGTAVPSVYVVCSSSAAD